MSPLRAPAILAEVLISASRDGMIDSAHDLPDGGLIQAVVESALLGGKGARLVVPDGLDAFTLLFSESAGRAVVAVPRTRGRFRRCWRSRLWLYEVEVPSVPSG